MSTFLIIYLVAMSCNLVISAYFFREEYIAGKRQSLGDVLMYFGIIFVPLVNAVMLLLFVAVSVLAAFTMGCEWIGQKCEDITIIKGKEE